ncbi:MAG: hypothetical protein ACFE0J_12410 [Elainellaceae cyanobacterium]
MQRFLSLTALAATVVFAISLKLPLTHVSLAQVSPEQATPEQSPDPRIGEALEALNLSYEIEDDGAYRVGLQFNDGRTQTAWISSRTNVIGPFEIRKIISPAYRSDEELSSEVANMLLQDTARKKLGAWQTFSREQTHVAVFTAQINADSSAEELGVALSVVLQSADQMEEELTNGDRF